MFIGEVIETLRAEDFLATKDRIHNAIRGGYLEPKPRKASVGAFVFTKRHLDQLRHYLVHVRRGPPRLYKKPVDFPAEGHYDSLRRLERRRETDEIIERLMPMALRQSGWLREPLGTP